MSMSYSDREDMQEAANWQACFEAAEAAGITQDQAKDCLDGEHNCPLCPWGGCIRRQSFQPATNGEQH